MRLRLHPPFSRPFLLYTASVGPSTHMVYGLPSLPRGPGWSFWLFSPVYHRDVLELVSSSTCPGTYPQGTFHQGGRLLHPAATGAFNASLSEMIALACMPTEGQRSRYKLSIYLDSKFCQTYRCQKKKSFYFWKLSCNWEQPLLVPIKGPN